jgi:hypothetical protein
MNVPHLKGVEMLSLFSEFTSPFCHLSVSHLHCHKGEFFDEKPTMSPENSEKDIQKVK